MSPRSVGAWPVRVRRVLVAAVVATLAAVLGGCTGEPGPDPGGSPSPTATPTPMRSPAPERPAEMDRDDLEGAKAAAQYFLALYAYVYNTGDLSEWKAMSHPECVFCTSVIDNVTKMHDAGGHEEGGVIHVEQVLGLPPEAGAEYFGVDVWYTQAPGVDYNAAGEPIDEFDGGSHIAVFALATIDGQWVIRDVGLEPQP